MFWKKICSRQRSCPGQVTSSKTLDFLGKVLPQAAQLPQTGDFFKKMISGKVLPQAKQLPQTYDFFKKKLIFWKSSAPGSEAARDKWFVQQNVCFF